jgi:DNA-binding FadR family transcriptional regulator
MADQNRAKFKVVYPVRQRTTAEEIAVQIREMIHRAELRPGEQLPPERELARMLGVSRPTLRAGISALASMGVVRSRPGAGTFVVEEEVSPSLDSAPLRMMASLHGFTSAEMFECSSRGVRLNLLTVKPVVIERIQTTQRRRRALSTTAHRKLCQQC